MIEAVKEKLRTAKCEEYLRYDFTEKEFMEHARTLGRMNQELASAEERKKSVSADLAAEVKRCEDAVSHQSRLVSNGYEYRNLECEVRFHDPSAGKKTIVRVDTGETVKVASMTAHELQEAFDFTETAPEDKANDAA